MSMPDKLSIAMDILALTLDPKGPDELMIYEELANLLEIAPNEDGNLPAVKFFNACLHAFDNPNVRELPQKERMRALRSACIALGKMEASRQI